ncbi:MAG: acyl-CoA dehydrogenase family protein, partial [Reyranellaceae bacterium]
MHLFYRDKFRINPSHFQYTCRPPRPPADKGKEIIETEEHAAFRESCRRFAEQEIAPLVDEAERNGKYPKELRRKAGKQGFLSITAKPEYGG